MTIIKLNKGVKQLLLKGLFAAMMSRLMGI